MPRLIRRLLLLSVVCAGGAFGQVQGTFAQIAFGGSWQTTFTLINVDSTDLAGVTLSFFGDNGSPLNVPVQGFGSTSSYTFTIPVSGSTNVVLSSTDPSTPVTQGWATMSVTSGSVRGQGSFRSTTLSGGIFEAAVPLSTAGSTLCIIPFPSSSNPAILIPFDNTIDPATGRPIYITSLAIANTTNGPLSVQIEFDDQSNTQIATGTLSFTAASQHMAFVTTSPDRYPASAGKKGIIRIHAGTDSVTVLGLLSNANNAISTIIPITQ